MTIHYSWCWDGVEFPWQHFPHSLQWRNMCIMTFQISVKLTVVQQLVQADITNTTKLHITGPLWGESTSDQWVTRSRSIESISMWALSPCNGLLCIETTSQVFMKSDQQTLYDDYGFIIMIMVVMVMTMIMLSLINIYISILSILYASVYCQHFMDNWIMLYLDNWSMLIMLYYLLCLIPEYIGAWTKCPPYCR